MLFFLAFNQLNTVFGTTILPQQNQEKILLSFDRTNYVPGDIIWFSGYILSSEDHLLKGNEYFAHVCLYAPNGKLQSHDVFAIKKGTIKGQIKIPKLSYKGLYRIVAYTNWMRNWPTESLFQKQVWVNGEKTSHNFKFDYQWETTTGSSEDSLIISIIADTKNNDNNKFLNISTQLKTSKRKPTTASKLSSSRETTIKLPVNEDEKQDSLLLTLKVINNNSTSTREILILKDKQKPDVQFLPESGQLIPNILQTVAFKSIGADGASLKIKGKLYDNSDTEITSFKTDFDGMGKLTFTPEKDKTYYAKVTTIHNETFKYNLPQIEVKGAILQIISTNNNANLSIHTTGILAPLKLIVHCRGTIILEKEYTSLPSKNEIISLINYPKGIIHFTLLNSKNIAISERLMFNYPKQTIEVNFPEFKKSYAKRDSVVLPIQVNKLPKGQLALYNISVCDNNFVHPYLADNITTQMYLTSELPGYIPHATYYLEQTEASKKALDLLLLTKGYCRFNWQEINSSVENATNDVETNIYLKGQVRNILTNKPLKENIVGGNFYGKGNNIKKSKATDNKGNFKFEFPDINYNLSYTIDFAGKSGGAPKQVRATIETLLDVTEIDHAKTNMIVSKKDKGPTVPFQEMESLSLDKIALSDIVQLSKNTKREDNFFETGTDTIALPEVQIEKARNYSQREQLRKDFGPPLKIITPPQIMAMAKDVYWYSSIKHLISYLYPELESLNRKKEIFYVLNNRRIDFKDDTYSIMFNAVDPKLVTSIELFKSTANYDKYILLEEMAVTDHDQLMRLPPYILSITTTGGSGSWGNSGTSSYMSDVYGYTSSKIPYAPKYTLIHGDSIVYDARKTLFWNPLVVAKNSIIKPFNFYTGDLSGEKKIIIDGITTDGTPFYGETTLEVSANTNNINYEVQKPITDINTNSISNFERATNRSRTSNMVNIKYIDAKTRTIIAYTPIKTNTGTYCATNANGEAVIDKGAITTITLDKVGYISKKIATESLRSDSVLITLTPIQILDGGTTTNAHKLVAKAIRYTNKQMNQKNDLTSFFREKIYKNGNIVSLEEWYLNSNIYSFGVNNIESTINFVKGKTYKTFDFNEVIKITPNQRDNNFAFNADPMNDRKQFLDLVYMKYYNYTIEGNTEINGKECSIVLFDVKPNEYVPGYQGRLVIGNEENYIHEVTYTISPTNKEYLDESTYIHDNPGIGDIELEKADYYACFNCEENNYFPILLHEKIKISINNKNFQTFERELLTSKSNTELDIENREESKTKKHTYLVRNPLYDKAFFEDITSTKLPLEDEKEIPFLHEISRFR